MATLDELRNGENLVYPNSDAGGAVSSLNGLGGPVSIVAGAGISVATASPNITITNTGPTVDSSLTSAGGTETLVNDGTGPALATKGLTAGTGISLSSDATSVTVTNSSPASSVTMSSPSGTSMVSDGVGPALGVKGISATEGIRTIDAGTEVSIRGDTYWLRADSNTTNHTTNGTQVVAGYDAVRGSGQADFNTGTGLFTAPVSGHYHVTYNAIIFNNVGGYEDVVTFGVRLGAIDLFHLQQTAIVRENGASATDKTATASGSMIVAVAAGDTLSVTVTKSSNNLSGMSVYFSVTRIESTFAFAAE